MRGRPGEVRDWAAVVAWSLVIFTAIPLARRIQGAVRESLGSETFGWLVVACAVVGATATLQSLRRAERPLSASRVFWLLATTGVLIGYTALLWGNPEEAVHLLQYGVLGILLHRALAHRLHDSGIYFVAAALGALVGIVDEFIQWLTPGRYWGLRDVWLNFFAGAVVQLGIAFGVRPMAISGAPGPRSIRALCGATAACVLALGLSLLNTPPVILSLSQLPGLGFLASNETVMLEYGHLHMSPAGARFRSRFSVDELRVLDARRGAEAAAILDEHRSDNAYSDFLDRYTPITDPFVHEARVHLFRRDRHLARAKVNPKERYRREGMSVAFHENQILEHYFTETLGHSSYVFDDDLKQRIEADFLPSWPYESAVSRKLLTGIGSRGVLATMLTALAALYATQRRFGQEPEQTDP